jgi:Zn-dependent M28 family amino/carboxypeptidase
MKHQRGGSLLVGVLAVGNLATAGDDPASVLMRRALGPTPILEDLRQLTDTIGGRPPGSAAVDRAVDWGVARFREAGLENVHAEPYAAARTWLAGAESAKVLAPRATWATPGSEHLRIAAMPFSAPTPAAGLEAEVVDGGDGDAPAFAAAGARVAGRLVLFHTTPMRGLEDLFKEYMETPGRLARAREAGAVGVLWMSTRSGRLLYRHNTTLDGSLYRLPAAVVEREGALRLARLAAAGETIRVRLVLDSRSNTGTPARNVVAEVKGREKPDEVVILGAHLDSWDLGRGALDNGGNAALVIDVARQAAALAHEGIRPRRTLRFVLYTGEEAGLWGSFAEVRQHRGELDRVKAQVIFDIGSGKTTGFSLGGRADLQPAVDAVLAPASSRGPFTQTTDAFIGTDNYDYLVEGVPTLVANQDGLPYLADYHAESDTFDKVDQEQLKANTAIAAVVTWGLADLPAAPAPRQSRSEVEALVQATGLVEQMRLFGLWEPFVRGERGRAP